MNGNKANLAPIAFIQALTSNKWPASCCQPKPYKKKIVTTFVQVQSHKIFFFIIIFNLQRRGFLTLFLSYSRTLKNALFFTVWWLTMINTVKKLEISSRIARDFSLKTPPLSLSPLGFSSLACYSDGSRNKAMPKSSDQWGGSSGWAAID